MNTRRLLSAGLAALANDAKAVVANYADIAHAGFEDSLTSAQVMQKSIIAVTETG